MQIQNFGKQDADTVLQPTMSFWKTEYARHTPFALEPKTVEFLGQPAYGRRFNAKIERIADMCGRIWIVTELGRLNGGLGGARFVDDVGRAMINDITIQLGTTDYDKIYPEIMHAEEELQDDIERQLGKLTGKSGNEAELENWAMDTQYIYTPLDSFWFGQDYSQYLPLIGLYLTDFKIYVTLKNKSELIVGVGGPYVVQATDAEILNMYLLVETVLLDDPERNFFASTPLKWIMTQHQFSGSQTIRSGSTYFQMDLHFNHPTKELTFLYRRESNTTALNYFNFSGEETGPFNGEAFKSLGLKFNSNDRFTPQNPFFFRVLQPKCHHSRIPQKHIYVYSFALYPQDLQPSGSVNFSRIDNTRINLTFTAALAENAEFQVYGKNINSFTLNKGIALLAFAS
jgi:hypothetical protein